MKKKIILSHILTLLASFAMMLTLFCVVTEQINKKNMENSIRSNLSVMVEVFRDSYKTHTREEAIDQCVSVMEKTGLDARYTFLDYTGKVLYDNDTTIEENHLSRPEIMATGAIFYRHSTTLDIDMVYLACYLADDTMYIRIAMPMSSVNRLLYQIIIISTSIMVLLLILIFLLDYFFINHELKPLKEGSEKLSRLVSSTYKPTKNEIESITQSIHETEILFQEKVSDLTQEKEKMNYIINTMSQGLIILDSKENVLLLNLMAKKIFSCEEVKTLPQVTILPEIYTVYHHALKKKEENVIIDIKERRYLVSTHSIENVWVNEGEIGCSLLFVDVTDEQRLETAKKDFFANASHELKSPLTSILGYTQMIKEGFLTEKEDIDDALGKIQSEGKRMNEIIIGMLELSRLESEDTEVKDEENSLLSIVKEEMIPFEEEAKRKQITVSLEGADFKVYAPKEDIASLVKNLLENAIRYNKEDGKVYLRLDQEKRSLSVQDTGIGIDEKDQKRVFERFYRVDKARSRKLGGTGLGLSIVKHICNNNLIQVKLESKLGVGSTFTLTFPEKEK